jgi:hypothetical protein
LTCPPFPDRLIPSSNATYGDLLYLKEANREHTMRDMDDVELKKEMDEIMRSVESVMKRIETVLPSQKKDPPEHAEE